MGHKFKGKLDFKFCFNRFFNLLKSRLGRGFMFFLCCFNFFKYVSVGDSKSVLTNSIPFNPKSFLAIRGNSRFFHLPARISYTSAHFANEISFRFPTIESFECVFIIADFFYSQRNMFAYIEATILLRWYPLLFELASLS